MKVKIGNKIYSPEDQPIMIILTQLDKDNINNMLDTATKYCVYDVEKYTTDDIKEFMQA